MKQIIANLSAALTFVLITLLYYGSAAGLSNRLFSSIMSTDMWLTAAFLLIYLLYFFITYIGSRSMMENR